MGEHTKVEEIKKRRGARRGGDTLHVEVSDTFKWEDGTPVACVVPPLTEHVAQTIQQALAPLGLAFMMIYEQNDDGTQTPRKPPYAFLVKAPDGTATTASGSIQEEREEQQ